MRRKREEKRRREGDRKRMEGRKGEAVRAKDGTSLLTFLLVEVIVPRDHLHGSTSHCQTANLVVLHSTIHSHNVGRARGIVETRGLGGGRWGRKIQSSMQKVDSNTDVFTVFTLHETSATRFRRLGSSNSTPSPSSPSTTTFPNIIPRSRIFLVSSRVSMPCVCVCVCVGVCGCVWVCVWGVKQLHSSYCGQPQVPLPQIPGTPSSLIHSERDRLASQ